MLEFTEAVLTILAVISGCVGFFGLMVCATVNGLNHPLFGQSVLMLALGVVLALPLLVF
jgi:hypothetical protein